MSGKMCSAEIRFEDKVIKVGGPREFVESMVARYTDSSKWQAKSDKLEYYSDSEINRSTNIERNLIAAKQPHGHHEIVAVVAFALTESGRREFSEDDVRRAYIRAGVRPPKVVAQALRDAKNKYEYVELAGERGRYRLTNHGDRVVRFDLPRSRSN
jgi:hypothetical protein